MKRLMTIQNEGKGLLNGLVASENSVRTLEVRDSSALLFSSVMWVNMPMATSSEYEFKSYDDIPCDVTIDLNVSKPYAKTYSHNGTAPAQCGLSGSPTKVKKIENIIFQAKESKTMTGSDEDIENLIVELLANHTIG